MAVLNLMRGGHQIFIQIKLIVEIDQEQKIEIIQQQQLMLTPDFLLTMVYDTLTGVGVDEHFSFLAVATATGATKEYFNLNNKNRIRFI